MTDHRVEFKWDIISSIDLPDDGGTWKLENVTGKLIANGADLLTYRLVYSIPQGRHLGNACLLVKVWPELPEHGRRQGRPEAGFLVVPPNRDAVKQPGSSFYAEPSYAAVVIKGPIDGVERVSAIYFSLEDCNFEPAGLPLWRLSVDDSLLLARLPCLKGRWTPLAPVHPDPAVDPGVPIQLRPQHSPRW